MVYIFLDESGDFTKHNHEQYFVVASFTVGDQNRTAKKFKSWCKERFPKKMRKQSEIKWSATGITDELRLRTLKHIAKMDVRIRYGYLLRNNIPISYRQKTKIHSGILYTNIVGEVLEMYVPTDDKEIHIFCDQRSLKGMTKSEFEEAIQGRLLPLCLPGTMIYVKMIDSTSNVNMQIVDWIAGGLSRYLEDAALGKECYRILKNNLLGEGKEFFAQ